MPAELAQPADPTVPALAYDELPEGSALRREYDGRGGVTITAPAGELPPSVRRSIAREGLVPASFALAACVVLVGLILFFAARSNRLDPALRTAAVVTLGVLGGGVFLFVWLAHYAMLADAMSLARRQSTVLHADARRILVETKGPAGEESLEVPAESLQSFQVSCAIVDTVRRSAPVPCLQVNLRSDIGPFLLGGHHVAELRWVAATLAEVTGAPALSPRSPDRVRVIQLVTWGPT